MTIKVLITDTNRWALSARVAISLASAGCQVSAVCPTPGHALAKTRAAQRIFRYSGLSPLESLTNAIETIDPDIVVPACDRSVGHLHELYAQAKSRGEAGSKIATLIERSLGSPASYATVSSRYELLSVASQQKVRVPNMKRINTLEDFDSLSDSEPFPWVLKADGTWGGGGVCLVHTREEAEASFKQLSQISRFPRAIKRLVVNRDSFWMRPWWVGSKRAIIAQSYVKGRPANCAVMCWQGSVLAVIGVEVICSEGATGPACVVRIVDNAEIKFAAQRIACGLNLSGFFGLDFMLDDTTEAAYLIEMNPRATPPCHLRLGNGLDLAGALQAQLAGEHLPASPPVMRGEMVAYFPQGFKTDRNLLQSCFQDVPQGEPELVSELLRPFPDRTLLFRLVQRLSRASASARASDLQMYRNFERAEVRPMA